MTTKLEHCNSAGSLSRDELEDSDSIEDSDERIKFEKTERAYGSLTSDNETNHCNKEQQSENEDTLYIEDIETLLNNYNILRSDD